MEDSYEFIWVDGSAVAGEENFVKWFNDTEEHQPVWVSHILALQLKFNCFVSSGMNGSARGSLMYADSKSGFWQTRDKMEKLGFVCEKKINDFCIFDMTEYGSYCLDFRLDGRYDLHSWGGARQDCNKYGMTMLQIGGESKDEFINQIFEFKIEHST